MIGYKKKFPMFFVWAVFLVAAGCGSGDGNGWTFDVQDAPGDQETVPLDAEPEPTPETPADGFPEPADIVPFDDICGQEDLPLQYNVSSDVLIVLDRSGSMMGMLAGVKDAVNTVVGASEEMIWFGLMPFPNSVPPNECRLIAPLTVCLAPSAPHVTLGPNRAADIAAVLAGLTVCGNTPTKDTLRRARAYLNGAGTGHTQYVLLATDGLPNCNGSLDGSTCYCPDDPTVCADDPYQCIDHEETYAAIDDLSSDGIKTYVLGMGSWGSADQDIMNEMASRGGTGSFYPAERPEDLLAAFEAIMGTVVLSCQFDLHPTGDVDATKVNFYIDGTLVPRDESHGNGWDYVDEDTVEFYGDWCTGIMSGDVSGVSATFGCPTVFI
jgi:hypothetical protein